MSNALRSDARIWVAGHTGLAGSAIVRALGRAGHTSVLTRTHAELELTNAPDVCAFLREERPEYVVLAAARVGGILANATRPADFLFENLAIELNVIRGAFESGVRRLLFLGSSCIYPRDCAQPIREEYLLTGPLEETNRAYALAKIAGVELCRAFNRQHGTHFLAAMPTNLYGPGDNYHLEDSHVLPALVRKIVEAKHSDAAEVLVWGSGKPRREFLHSDDMAAACVALMNLSDDEFGSLCHDGPAPALINIGCGEDLAVSELAQLICSVAGYRGRLVFDTTRPDGTPRKLLDVSRIRSLGWAPQISLERGLRETLAEFSRVSSLSV